MLINFFCGGGNVFFLVLIRSFFFLVSCDIIEFIFMFLGSIKCWLNWWELKCFFVLDLCFVLIDSLLLIILILIFFGVKFVIFNKMLNFLLLIVVIFLVCVLNFLSGKLFFFFIIFLVVLMVRCLFWEIFDFILVGFVFWGMG